MVLSTIEAANRRVTLAFADAARRGHEEILASQQLTLQYCTAVDRAATAVTDEGEEAIKLSGQLMQSVEALDRELAKLLALSEDVQNAHTALGAMERLLDRLEQQPRSEALVATTAAARS